MTDCIDWDGYVNPGGYGQLSRSRYAHRLAYEAAYGPIPAGLVIDHLCRNRRCVNPDHLEAVTMRENLLRGEGPTAQKAAQTHCIHGHEFTFKNTHIKKNGCRACRECNRLYQLNIRRSRKAAATLLAERA